MTNHLQFENSSAFKARRAKSRGIALVTTLLLLSLMVAMTLAMVIAVSSDTLITRYYRNFRASFYAADSSGEYRPPIYAPSTSWKRPIAHGLDLPGHPADYRYKSSHGRPERPGYLWFLRSHRESHH